MRIAIVNDMRMAVESLRRVLSIDSAYAIAWTAFDGEEAVKKCQKDCPDIILMDLIMPVMDGVEATRRIMEKTPCIILIVTATVEGNRSKVFEAMGYGALDVVQTPVLGVDGKITGAVDLLEKIDRLGKLLKRPAGHKEEKMLPHKRPPKEVSVPPLVVIGSSTGGPKALSVLLSQLPATFNAAVVIVQHVDVQFISGLMSWLGNQTSLSVVLAENGAYPKPGIVYLAATDEHLVMTPNLQFGYTSAPMDYPYRPSVDVFFNSVASNWPGKGIGVLLTGIGRDGAEGMLVLHNAGWYTIAQDKKSCVVYGMPKAAAELGAVDEVLAPDKIGEALIKRTDMEHIYTAFKRRP